MAISTYGELLVAVRNWMHRSSDDERVPEFIKLFEAKINRDLHLSIMETTQTSPATLTAGTATLALPADYLTTRVFYLNGEPKMEVEVGVSAWELFRTSLGSETRQPKVAAVIGSNLHFGGIPDSNYAYTHWYIRKADLAADAAASPAVVTPILTHHPDLYLYGTLCEYEPYIGDDERMVLWKLRLDEAWQQAKMADDRRRFGRQPLRARVS